MQVFPSTEPSGDGLERGWRYIRVPLPDGREETCQVLLTPDNFLNPEVGDVWPQNPFDEQATRGLTDMLMAYFANRSDITIFRDLIMD